MMGFAAIFPSYILILRDAHKTSHPGMRFAIAAAASLRVKLSLRRAQCRRSNVERARTLVLVLAVRQHSTAVPAKPRRERLRLANDTALLIARKIDDVAWRHYEFLNHGILAA